MQVVFNDKIMTWKKLILILLSITVYSCSLELEKDGNSSSERKAINNPLYGEWVLIDAENSEDWYLRPRGFSISADTLEVYRGFYKRITDSTTSKKGFIYNGNFVSYEILNNSIYIDSSLNSTLGFPWEIKKNTFDSLIVSKNYSRIYKFIHPNYKTDQILQFDKVIYSVIGSYWSTPVFDISMDTNGNVQFRGGRFVEPLGFYTGKLDNNAKEYILKSFDRCNIFALNDKYCVNATDQESVEITFVKNGKIIKSISDYGNAFPRELFWACVPLRNLYITNKFDYGLNEEQAYLDLYLFAFEKNGLALPINKSESFYLQTELRKSKTTDTVFNPKFEIPFREIYFFLEQNLDKKQNKTVTSIKTDGRFYKFSFKHNESITYDLGYNFIERNYNEKVFYKPTEGYRW
ncbi:MAG: hypothetical protein GXO89_05535 [Chlorobi bacterium]|nr:hypothetical protein [Chlorobiota bacterium]